MTVAPRPRPVSFSIPLLSGTTVIPVADAYRIDRPQGMDAWILNLTTGGRGQVWRDHRQFQVETGELLLFPPQVPHDYGAADGHSWTHQWAYFTPRSHWLDWLAWPTKAGGILHLDLRGHPMSDRIRQELALLVAIGREATPAVPRPLAQAMAHLELALLGCDAANPVSTHATRDPRLQRVLDHCDRQYHQRTTVADLARLAGWSASQLAHRFRSVLGMSPQRYLEDRRLHAAQELLLTDGSSITSIAAQVGYDDPAFFARQFRRRFGISPRDFRLGRHPSLRPPTRTPRPGCADGVER